MAEGIASVRHRDLTRAQLTSLRDLFDREYRSSHGEWDPDRPYGYSPADVHVIATDAGRVIGHVGFQTRWIRIGRGNILIAGVGGVLVHPEHRSCGLGRQLMWACHESMLGGTDARFGYLGCREEVVPFYESVGWSRVEVVERCISREDQTTVEISANTPILIRPVHAKLGDWPEGDVDLRGTPW
ncbi:GNAT family N-acetyltransferase [Microbacterium chocolatum]|uniref:GNAT family N-acetyltransferase n=1 Tax=Microbacterium aurantiacum TaxID=162393 RepID=UPI00338D8581